MPPETATYKPSALPGYQLVQRNCMTCHAAQYASSQPPASPRAYWEATVKKMKKPFGAQFDDADMPAMVDYLVKTYGAERGAATTGAAVARPAAAAVPAANGKDVQTLLAANGCMACHALDQKVVGPGFAEVAARYKGKDSSRCRGGQYPQWRRRQMGARTHAAIQPAQCSRCGDPGEVRAEPISSSRTRGNP